jgi:hypothetical protein
MQSLYAPYDPSVFQKILSLDEAHESIHGNLSFEKLLQDFRQIATDLSFHDCFGLTLVHRHASIVPGQRMMDLKQTLQPLPLDNDAQDFHGCPIRPKSYALIGCEWKAYEYELGCPDSRSNSLEFLQEVQRRIEELGVPNVGLRRYSPSDPEELEVTEEGGISVKIPWVSVWNVKLFYAKTKLTVSRRLTTLSLTTKRLSGPFHQGI